jgi:hypothetical protein
MAKLGSIPMPKINGGTAPFQRLVAAQGRRITGVTPKVVDAFQNQPQRYLRKASSLQRLAGQGPAAGMKGTL